MTDIAVVNRGFVNSLIGNKSQMTPAKLITFYGTFSGGLCLLISKSTSGLYGPYIAIGNDSSNSILKPNIKFPS